MLVVRNPRPSARWARPTAHDGDGDLDPGGDGAHQIAPRGADRFGDRDGSGNDRERGVAVVAGVDHRVLIVEHLGPGAVAQRRLVGMRGAAARPEPRRPGVVAAPVEAGDDRVLADAPRVVAGRCGTDCDGEGVGDDVGDPFAARRVHLVDREVQRVLGKFVFGRGRHGTQAPIAVK